jgi:MinD superfamily P-loop ATPase
MRVAVASGKGGTGKTFVTVNLARTYNNPILVLDCDVEEPNTNLFLKGDLINERPSTILVPQVVESLCDGCRICAEVCEFNAIAVIAGKPLIFEDLCHSCGACATFCPQDALQEVEHVIGTVIERKSDSIRLIEGQIHVGKALAVPIIRDVKKESEKADEDMVLLDSPPGTSCPMVWTIGDADFVILVAEPTAFGLHDLQLAVETVEEVGIPFGVVINKDGIGDDRVEKFCTRHQIDIIARIPYDRHISEVYARGGDILEEYSYQVLFENLWQVIQQKVESQEVIHA